MKTPTAKLFMASLLSLLLCCAASFSLQSSTGARIPQGWKRVNADGRFTLFLPSSAWDTGFSGTEDFYKEYRIGRMRLMFVYQPTSILSYEKREQEFGKGFRESVIEIAGRKAYLFEYAKMEKGRRRYYVDLYVGDFPKGEVKLWLEADSSSAADLETARKIFHTVEFVQ